MEIHFLIFVGIILVPLLLESSIAIGSDIISQVESIKDDNNTLVSSDGRFELGFFSPGSSTHRYLGIWYKKIPVRTVVWVANRHKPIKGSSGTLIINSTGHVIILGENSIVVWSANQTKLAKQTPFLQLLDSGNLVLKDGSIGSEKIYLWQSFDYPSDTLLPEMKLGWDLKTGVVRRLSSWKSSDDPSPGDFSYGLEHNEYPEAIAWKGTKEYFRSGPWNGLRYSGAPELKTNQVHTNSFVSNSDEVYFMYHLVNKSLISRLVANLNSHIEGYVWIESDQNWRTYLSVPKDLCDNYGTCGAYGNCVISELPICQCLDGFKPKSPEKWNSVDWSGGCVRNKPLKCHDSFDGFVQYTGLKLPDTKHTWVNKSMSLKECSTKCLDNCSCMAFTNSDTREGGSGCVMWLDDLIDIRVQLSGGGQDIYIRMHDIKKSAKNEHKVKTTLIIIAVTVVGLIPVVLSVICYICRRKGSKPKDIPNSSEITNHENEGNKEDLELPLFDLCTIATATNNFSFTNKLGEGGYGPVYKGVLEDGLQIAVKRLSLSSGQGANEFKNEVRLIANLQHRNLVKLLGCCVQGGERLLVYEYLPNKSLDTFIFDPKQSKLLKWPMRFQIICGIVRGLLYLHQDSRLRIIHRDLKASNILLDKEMNPKISDFGIARICGGDQTEGNTNRVVGTYGYMAPEYAFDGLFSTKSDVFSFGILLLEIVSGQRSRGFHHENDSLTLIGYAWTLMIEGKPFELVDPYLRDSHDLAEVLRSIHIGLLCVQQNPVDRPSMSSVVLMLSSESALSQPKEPGYFMKTNLLDDFSSPSQHVSISRNDMSITALEAR